MSAKGSGWMSAAALICLEPGWRTRLLYRLITYHGRKNEPKGSGVRDFQTLLMGAHQLLGAPIVVVWDSLGRHTCAQMRAFINDHDWLTVRPEPVNLIADTTPASASWTTGTASWPLS
ncbi:hypothetical protein ACIBF6_07825 [Streptosporangium amethystogenes]|uniref:hypothetical protein n=1 Tax=Streptosporangium amethystogenes TaxID=2002 RepID=UPI00379415A4